MNKLDGIKLEPLFYSEINSSFILKTVLVEKNIASDFIKQFLGLSATNIDVNREKETKKDDIVVGSIDLLISFYDDMNRKCALIIEVKIHDYLSATKDQIIRYYDALSSTKEYHDIYLMYLTQFNERNLSVNDEVSRPNTISNFQSLLAENPSKSGQFKHINWIEMHKFLDNYHDALTPEIKVMVQLQKLWIFKQIEKDKENHKAMTGKRPFSDLFCGMDPSTIFPELKSHNQKSKEVLEINLKHCTQQKLDELFLFIVDVTKVDSLSRKYSLKSEEIAIQSAQKFLNGLILDHPNYKLLGFYVKLFDHVLSTSHIQLNGKGNISLIANHNNVGKISICTILSSHRIKFSLIR
jgi:hypothetical protein